MCHWFNCNIAVSLLAFFWSSSLAWALEPVDLELVLAVDISGSVDQDEALLQRQGYVEALRSEEVQRAIAGGILGKVAISYFEWASTGDNRLLADWTLIKDAASANNLASVLAEAPIRSGLRTSISSAIDFAIPRFRTVYEGARRVIDISGDGPNNDGSLVDEARQRALAAGIVINGLPIINDRPNRFGFPSMHDLDKYYEGCVIGGPGAFLIVAEDFKTFGVAVRRKLLLEIAGLPAPLRPVSRSTVLKSNNLKSNNLKSIHIADNAYNPGCDIGERRSRDYYRERIISPN